MTPSPSQSTLSIDQPHQRITLAVLLTGLVLFIRLCGLFSIASSGVYPSKVILLSSLLVNLCVLAVLPIRRKIVQVAVSAYFAFYVAYFTFLVITVSFQRPGTLPQRFIQVAMPSALLALWGVYTFGRKTGNYYQNGSVKNNG